VRQSLSALHSTHTPAMLLLAVLPHTRAEGSLPEVHAVPVDAGSKCGASGVPWQEGSISHALVEVGMSVGSPCAVEPPEPSQTTFWQSPGVCSNAGATVLPGYAQVPVVSQSVAPQAGTDAGHVVVQQWPVPVVPQRPLTHWSFAAHTEPALFFATHVLPLQ